MEQAKYDLMKGMLSKLEDVKNSQESILDKINHIVTDLFQHPDKELEKAMENAHDKASKNLEAVQQAIEVYEMKFNKEQL